MLVFGLDFCGRMCIYLDMSKPPLKLSDLPAKQQAQAMLMREGVKTKELAAILGYSEGTVHVYASKLRKLDLTDPKIVSSAHKSLKKLVAGKTFGDIKEIKDITALRAIEMIVDRDQPKVTVNQNLNINTTIAPVDLSAYRTGSPAGDESIE